MSVLYYSSLRREERERGGGGERGGEGRRREKEEEGIRRYRSIANAVSVIVHIHVHAVNNIMMYKLHNAIYISQNISF